jgi:glycosyltransferase involved in cell wall biosynthesis
MGIDLFYFASPVQALAEQFSQPYVATVWDLGIVELGHFPEFSGHYGRKMFDVLNRALPRAFRVVVDSEATGKKLVSYFSLDSSRVVPVGLPMPNAVEATEPLPGLPQEYVVYPAKYWPHKNHETLFAALRSIAGDQRSAKLVLTGIDPNDFPAIESRLSHYGITDAVVIFPRITSGELLSVVKGARALLMPSMLGPTNYPPLEAMSVGTPVILSDAHSYDFDLPAGTVTVPCLDHGAWARAITEACANKRSVEPFHPDSLFQPRFSELLDEFRAVSRLWRS